MTLISSEEAKEFMDHQKQIDPNKSGIINKGDDWYYADQKYLSNSQMGHLLDGGPQHLLNYYRNGSTDTEAFMFGRAAHCYLLEKDQFNSRFYSIDDTEKCIEVSGKTWKSDGKKPRSTKAYKEWISEIKEENQHRHLLSFEDMTTIVDMVDKAMGYKQIREMIESAHKREQIYTNNLLGVDCKIKTDAINPGNFILDYKTSKDPATIKNFRYSVKKYHYDRAGAFYRDVSKTQSMWFIAQEKTYPYTVCLVEMSKETYEKGKIEYEHGLALYEKHFIKNPDQIKNYFEMGTV